MQGWTWFYMATVSQRSAGPIRLVLFVLENSLPGSDGQGPWDVGENWGRLFVTFAKLELEHELTFLDTDRCLPSVGEQRGGTDKAKEGDEIIQIFYSFFFRSFCPAPHTARHFPLSTLLIFSLDLQWPQCSTLSFLVCLLACCPWERGGMKGGRLVVVSSSAAFVLSTVHKWCAIGEPNTCTLAYFSHTTQQSAGMFWVGLFFPWATAKRSTRTRKWVQYWQCFDRLGTRRRWTLVITPSRAAVTKCDMISRLFLVFSNTVGSLLVLWWIVFERFNPQVHYVRVHTLSPGKHLPSSWYEMGLSGGQVLFVWELGFIFPRLHISQEITNYGITSIVAFGTVCQPVNCDKKGMIGI